MVFVAREEHTDSVARAVTAAGGTVEYRRDDVGYLRADMPVDDADLIAERGDVEGAAVDFVASTLPTFYGGRGAGVLLTPGLRGGPRNDTAVAHSEPAGDLRPDIERKEHPWGRTPRIDPWANAYSPLDALGAAAWRRESPTFDGRGVTIGQVELGVDLLLPEFEVAVGLDGRPTRKLADMRTSVSPNHRHPPLDESPWVVTTEVVTDSRRPTFTAGARTYEAPRVGRFRYGWFDAGRRCRAVINWQSISRDATSPCQFALLWDEQTDEVWLDTNRDDTFAHERALKPYSATGDIGILGRDDLRTLQRESLAYTVQTSRALHAVAINLGWSPHATMVAGSAVASLGSRGRIEGVAPGARLSVIDYGLTCLGNLIEGLIDAFTDPQIDIVLLEQQTGILAAYRIGDGRSVATMVTGRLIAKYRKPFVVPGGNTPQLQGVTDHGNVHWGFTAGAYETKNSYRINDGLNVQHEDNLHHGIGSGGPTGLGGIKPDVVVPSGYLTTAARTSAPSLQVGLYRLPAGYAVGGGTSQAGPTLAGAIALLISAAKQRGVPYDAESIWRAVTDSARPLGTVPIYLQGHGAVDVAAAFKLLEARSTTAPVRIISRASVRTPYSRWLQQPDEGVGIWESEGWSAGQHAERTVWLTRTTGDPGPMRFTTSWRGATKTFGSAAAVVLPLGVEVPVTVNITPSTPGVHSAVLTLDRPGAPGHAYRLMTTIVVPDSFARKDQYTHHITGTLKVTDWESSYASVPTAAEALIFDADGARLGVMDPLGQPGWTWAGRHFTLLPRPGSWEIVARIEDPKSFRDFVWTAAPDALVPPLPYSLDIAPLAVRLDAPPSLIVEAGDSAPLHLTMTNLLGPFEGGLVPMALAEVRTERTVLKQREQRVYEIHIPEGAPILQVSVGGFDVVTEDVDLYLFDCTGSLGCKADAAAPSLGIAPRVRRLRPNAGLWKAVVDGSRVRPDGASVEYEAIVATPSLGAIAVTDVTKRRSTNAQWTSAARVWLARAPSPGRDARVLLVVNAIHGDFTLPVGLATVPISPRVNTHE